jgi:uncharacterized protein
MSAALLHIKQIPIERVESIELELEPDEISEMMVDLGDYELASPEDFGVTVRVQRVGDLTVRLTGEARAKLAYTCGRCLERRHVDVAAPFEYVLIPKPAWSERYEGAEEVALGEDDLDLDSYEGEEIDVRPFIREAVVLELPSYSPCTVEQEAECDEAYARLVGDEVEEELEEAKIDLRWSKLAELKKQMSEES